MVVPFGMIDYVGDLHRLNRRKTLVHNQWTIEKRLSIDW